MEPIKIETQSRNKAFDCEYCRDRTPHMHFYVQSRKGLFKSFEECFAATRERMISYAETCAEEFPVEFYSFTGMSKEEYVHPNHILAAAEKMWAAEDCTLEAKTVTCLDLFDDNVTKLMAEPGFKGIIK